MATDAVGSEQVCSVLEQLRNEQHVVEYVVYDTSDVRNPKKVAGAGGLAEAGGEQAALSSMLRTVGSCLAAGETFKRMSVSYPDCVYYALVIGQYQVRPVNHSYSRTQHFHMIERDRLCVYTLRYGS